MAGLWEPVSGVFWSAPPPVVVPDEGLSVYWFIVSALVVATVIVAGMWHNARKAEPVKWNLRNHLGKVGSAMTYAYLVVIVAMIWGRSGQLLNMPLNEVGDFLAGAFGPVAFLWLVLGFLQQGEELRLSTKALDMQSVELKQSTKALLLQAEELKNSVEQQTIMAAAATQQIEAQKAILNADNLERERALRANFTVTTGITRGTGKAGEVMSKIRIRNDGSNAYNAVLRFDPPVGSTEQITLGDWRREGEGERGVTFDTCRELQAGGIEISYYDHDGLLRHESFHYELYERSLKISKVRTSSFSSAEYDE
ncbi:hypothetical protein [Pseudomonas monteilii]|uniref:hypothetical protein n=1 Tax=Pseudomonas monteilii TaxID=76759 RepID=UPI0036E50D51